MFNFNRYESVGNFRYQLRIGSKKTFFGKFGNKDTLFSQSTQNFQLLFFNNQLDTKPTT